MATNYNSYFADLRSEGPRARYPEDECSVLVSYLDGDISARQCATEITAYNNRRLPASSKLCIWSLIVQIACDFVEKHDDLIAIIEEIRSIPASKDTGGIDWTKEAQSFDETFRSFYDSVWGRSLDADNARGNSRTPDQSDISRQWTNINRFDARLEHAGLGSDLDNALRLIVKVLETTVSPAQVEMNLGAVAAWLEIAGKEIKRDAATAMPGSEWAVESNYSKIEVVDGKRLAFWSDRLSELSASPGLSEEVVDGCERATITIGQALWEKKRGST